jgi:hypothetical protein
MAVCHQFASVILMIAMACELKSCLFRIYVYEGFAVSSAYVRDCRLPGLHLTHPEIAGATCGKIVRMAEWAVTDCRGRWSSTLRIASSRNRTTHVASFITIPVGLTYSLDRPYSELCWWLWWTVIPFEESLSHVLQINGLLCTAACCCSYILLGGFRYTSLLHSVLL